MNNAVSCLKVSRGWNSLLEFRCPKCDNACWSPCMQFLFVLWAILLLKKWI